MVEKGFLATAIPEILKVRQVSLLAILTVFTTYQHHISQEPDMTVLNIYGGSQSLCALCQHVRTVTRRTVDHSAREGSEKELHTR